MMDERITAKKQIISRPQNTQRVVVIFVIARAEAAIKKSNLFKHLALEKIAKANQRRSLLPKFRIRLIVICSKILHVLKVFIVRSNHLIVRAAVCHAAHGANLRTAVESASEILEPALCDNGITVQKQKLRSRRDLQALIAALGKT